MDFLTEDQKPVTKDKNGFPILKHKKVVKLTRLRDEFLITVDLKRIDSPPCGSRKIAYSSQSEALEFIANFKRLCQVTDHLREYHCEDCGKWHLTSMELDRYLESLAVTSFPTQARNEA